MDKIERALKGLRCCIKQGQSLSFDCSCCPYWGPLDCWITMNKELLELIKEFATEGIEDSAKVILDLLEADEDERLTEEDLL